MSVPVSEMTDAAVLVFWMSRWDYQLLKTNDVPTADYAKAKVAYQQLTKATKAETRAAHEAQFLVQKRLLLTKLMELRAAAGQARRMELRTASAAISERSEGRLRQSPARHAGGDQATWQENSIARSQADRSQRGVRRGC